MVCAHAQSVVDHLKARMWLSLPARLLGPWSPWGRPLRLQAQCDLRSCSSTFDPSLLGDTCADGLGDSSVLLSSPLTPFLSLE